MTSMKQMRSPIPSSLPSEGTIEQIANHQILSLLSPYGTWFYVPTKPEEKNLGYDASLQNHKALVIQYKRLHPNLRGARVNLSAGQHSTLRSLFPPAPKPYVFYGFALHETYDDIAAEFSSGFGFFFGMRTIFIDAHSIPTGARSISIKFNPYISVSTMKTSLGHFVLPTLVNQFRTCNVGLRSELLNEPPYNDVPTGKGKGLPNLNIMWGRVN
jgi:hypothetical protein